VDMCERERRLPPYLGQERAICFDLCARVLIKRKRRAMMIKVHCKNHYNYM
jgi:hypothetical protein